MGALLTIVQPVVPLEEAVAADCESDARPERTVQLRLTVAEAASGL